MKIITIVLLFIAACGKPEKGDPGPAGATGEMGVQGARGATGPTAGGAVASFSSCAKTVSGFFYAYDAVGFSDGSRFVSCSVAGAAFTVSQSDYWTPTQSAATAGTCSVTFDLDTASGGFWVFELAPKQAKYFDATSTSNGMTVSFAAADCKTS